MNVGSMALAPPMRHLLVIEGVIGSGKSTCLTYLRSMLTNRNDIVFFEEPVELFQSWNGFFPLELLEEAPLQNAAAVQLHIVRTLQRFYTEAMNNLPREVKLVVCDRYLQSAYVFIDVLLSRGYITAFTKAILEAEVDTAMKVLPEVDAVLYLDTSLVDCRERIQQRARRGEVDFVNLIYLEQIRNSYFKVLKARVRHWYSTDCHLLSEIFSVFRRICAQLDFN